MRQFTSLDLAQQLVSATGCAIVQVVARVAVTEDSRSLETWSRQFPMLDDTEVHWLREEGVISRRYDHAGEAALAVMAFCEESMEGHAGSMTGTITIVLPSGGSGARSRGWCIGDDRRVVPTAPVSLDTPADDIGWTTEPFGDHAIHHTAD